LPRLRADLAGGFTDPRRGLAGAAARQVGEWTTYDRRGEVYKVTAQDRGGWRLDHVLVQGLEPVASAYAHEWRRAGLSDHSALLADLTRHETAAPTAA